MGGDSQLFYCTTIKYRASDRYRTVRESACPVVDTVLDYIEIVIIVKNRGRRGYSRAVQSRTVQNFKSVLHIWIVRGVRSVSQPIQRRGGLGRQAPEPRETPD